MKASKAKTNKKRTKKDGSWIDMANVTINKNANTGTKTK